MHELSICRAIARSADARAGGRPVRRINVRIGHLRQVVPDTLQWCWNVHSQGTAIEGCELHVDYVPAVVHCRRCGADTELTFPALRCGSCDGIDVELVSGEEFLIESIDVAEEVR